MNYLKTITLLSAFFISPLLSAQEQELSFDGFYMGLNVGIQNIFGGSLIEGEDILAQEYRMVTETSMGFRKQLFNQRWVVGAELHIGFLNADLEHRDEVRDLYIDYKSRFQSGIGLQTGLALGKSRKFLMLIYANETKRKFDVDIEYGAFDFSQTDKQGMLRYGMGLEYDLGPLNLRSTFGLYRVDFGDLPVNIDVEDKYDFTLGVIYQF